MFKAKNLKLVCLILLLGVMFISLLPSAKARALDPSNYSSYLTDDAIFENSGSMSQPAIQNFLASEGSYLANFTDIENCGPSNGAHFSFYATYYACGTSQLASRIIYDASQAYGINPQAIIATMQKEESLITTPNPTASQLDYAMGYGCPDSGSCSHPGFFNQVDNGTWQFKTDMELGSGNNWWGYTPSSYPCDSATRYYSAPLVQGNNVTFFDDNGTAYNAFVMPDMSTATLYCYTPHVYNNPSGQFGLPQYGYTGLYYSGSYNYVYYFTLWFGSTVSGVSVAQASGVGGLWAIYGGMKQLIASPSVEKAWGLFGLPVITMDANALNAMPARPVLTLLAINPFSSPGNPAYMVADVGGTFDASNSVVQDWGMNPATASTIGPELVAFTGRLGNLPIFISSPGETGIYMMDNGALRVFSNGTELNAWGGASPYVGSISNALFTSLATGSVVNTNQASMGGNSYFVDNGELYNLPAGIMPQIYPHNSQLAISSQLVGTIPSTNATRFVSSPGIPGIFLIDNQQKLLVGSPSLLQSYMANGETSQITVLSQAGLNSIPSGPAITNRFVYDLSTPSQAYYLNKVLNSLSNQLTGVSSYGVGLSDPTISWLGAPQGPLCSTDFISGSSGNTGIFLLDGGQKKDISNYPEYQLLNANPTQECQLPQEDFSAIPSGGQITPLVTNGSVNYLLDGGKSYVVNTAAQQGWAFTSYSAIGSGALAKYANGGNLSSSFNMNGQDVFVSDGNYYTTTNSTLASLWSSDFSQNHSMYVISYIHNSGQLSQFAHSNNPSHPGIYLVDQGKFIGIPNPEDFYNAGYKGQNLVGVNDTFLTSNTAASPWQGYLATDMSSGTIYVLEGGNKHVLSSALQANWLGSPQTVTPTSFSTNFLSLINTGSPVTNSFASPNVAGIYAMANGSKFVIPNYTTYLQSYAPYLQVSNNLVNAVP